MKIGAWALMGALTFGCAGKNTVAGSEKTKAEQLEAAVPSWCEQICARLTACSASCDCSGDVCDCPTAQADCPASCQKEMARFTPGDDHCAAVGEHFKTCLDGLSCQQLSDSHNCTIADTDARLCPNGATDDPPPDATGPATGPSVGGSGPSDAGSNGGLPSSGGAAPTTSNGARVGCTSAYGTAGAAGTSSAGSSQAVTCEEGVTDCSDGHEYNWICVRGSEGQLGCTCFVDSEVTGGFDPQSASCPTQQTVNLGCSWNIGF